jgi:hypothetical protein
MLISLNSLSGKSVFVTRYANPDASLHSTRLQDLALDGVDFIIKSNIVEMFRRLCSGREAWPDRVLLARRVSDERFYVFGSEGFRASTDGRE